jgi:hypothetical protein
MPGAAYNTDLRAGMEISEEGTWQPVATILESELLHPAHSDGLVRKGDPVIFGEGQIPGFAFESATANTDYIVVRLGGIWSASVKGENDAGNEALPYLTQVFFDPVKGLLNHDPLAGFLFGFTHASVGAGVTRNVPVQLYRS